MKRKARSRSTSCKRGAKVITRSKTPKKNDKTTVIEAAVTEKMPGHLELSPSELDWRNSKITESMQQTAVRLLMVPSTMMYIFTFIAGWLVLGCHNPMLFFYYFSFLTAAFCTAWILWHRYDVDSWRRKLDMIVTAFAVTSQTVHCALMCRCHWHIGMFSVLAISGVSIYFLGWQIRTWEQAMMVHLTTHFISYLCNMVIFSCAVF